MKIVKSNDPRARNRICFLLGLLALIVHSHGQIIEDAINSEALENTKPGEDPNLSDITPVTKEEVDEALDDELETINKDETKLSHEDELALEDLAQGYNPMAESSEASDTLQNYEDQIHDEEEDAKKEYGLFDLQSDSEKEHLLNFKKVSSDFKIFEDKKIGCLEKIPQEAWVLRELVICVGKNFSRIKNDMQYEKRKLLARAESRVRRVMAEQCYSEAGLDLNQSRACDLMEKDMLELLWNEMNYPALLKFHKEKYTFTHGKLAHDKFDKYMEFFVELHRRDSELLEEMTNHGEVALINIKRYIDDLTEHYAEEAKANGYEFNLDLAHVGIGTHTTHEQEHGHGHYHAIGQYDANFEHPNDGKDEYHDYVGDHAETVHNEGESTHHQSGEGGHGSSHGHSSGGYRGGGPAATNPDDIMDKYGEDENSEESESSEEYAQRIKDLAGYKEPEEEEEDQNEDNVTATRKFRRRRLGHPVAVRSRIRRTQIRKAPVMRKRQLRRRPMRRVPKHREPMHRMMDSRDKGNLRRRPLHKVEVQRVHKKLQRKMHSRNLKLKEVKKQKKEQKKSIADILKEYTYKLPGLKSDGTMGHLLKV